MNRRGNHALQKYNFPELFYTLELTLNLVELDPTYPKEPHTVGEHIRKRRLDLGLLQRQLAKQLGVNETTVHNWETSVTQPETRLIPKVIEFLGYNFLSPATTLGERIVRCRKSLGLSRKQLAKHLGIDSGTLWRWETERRGPKGKCWEIVMRWLKQE